MDLFKAISKQTSIWSLGVLVNEFKFREYVRALTFALLLSGITLWEIASFGRTPFQGLYNSEFLSKDSSEIVKHLCNGPGPVELTVSFGSESDKSELQTCPCESHDLF